MPARRRPLLPACVGLLAVVVAGCSETADPSATPAPSASPSTAATSSATARAPTDTSTPTPTATPTPTSTPTPTGLTDAELAELAVNEVGRVFVSEWHLIGTDTDGDYQNTLATFRGQLQTLYDRGYRPVTQVEYAAGTFPIPAGTSPVLLTFDDSSENHFRWRRDGVTPHPDSVVGILEDFAATHEDWRATAVFAINLGPFRDFDEEVEAAKLSYLLDNGFELSNHTKTHANLGQLDARGVQEEIAGNLASIRQRVPDAPVPTLTLPFGVHPSNDDLAASGSFDGVSYSHDLVYEVGWMPDNSPHHVDYDPMSVMRVPAHGPWSASDLDWWDWLDWMEDERLRKFVSDGDPDTVTYPASFREVAAPLDGLATRTYRRRG